MPRMNTSARLISISRSMYELILSKFVGAAPLGQNIQNPKTLTPTGFNLGFCMLLCLGQRVLSFGVLSGHFGRVVWMGEIIQNFRVPLNS